MLETYLNDHLAGATAGCDLARHLEDRFHGTPRAATFTTLRQAIEDRTDLVRLMAELNVPDQKIKQAIGWISEKIARIKFSGPAAGGADLGLVLAMEALGAGIQAKASLWENLRALPRTSMGRAEDLDRLLKRAQDQQATLGRERTGYAAEVFTAEHTV